MAQKSPDYSGGNLAASLIFDGANIWLFSDSAKFFAQKVTYLYQIFVILHQISLKRTENTIPMAKKINELNLFDVPTDEPNIPHPFRDRRIFVGGFSVTDRRRITDLVKTNGGTIATQISKNVHYAILGADTTGLYHQQIEKLAHNGFKIKELDTTDIARIESGDYESYITTAEIIKDLDLTYSHVEKHSVDMSKTNPITGKEIYIGDCFTGRVELLRQMAGNLSAFGNPDIYEDTNICLLGNETVEKLKLGQKDKTVMLIQNFYNSHKSVNFTLSFITENAFIGFIEEWCAKFDDSVTLDLLTAYKKSKSE